MRESMAIKNRRNKVSDKTEKGKELMKRKWLGRGEK